MTEPEKTLPFALLERYWRVRPRVVAALGDLRQHPESSGAATPVERALAAELITEVRRTTARDSFGRALRLLAPSDPLPRSELIARLLEAEIALNAFRALYHGGEEVENADEPYWRVDA